MTDTAGESPAAPESPARQAAGTEPGPMDVVRALLPHTGKYTEGDYRLLILTFAGTIAANVVTAMVVGAAIALSRAIRSDLPGGGFLIWAWVLGVCILVGAVSVLPLLLFLRNWEEHFRPGWGAQPGRSSACFSLDVFLGVIAGPHAARHWPRHPLAPPGRECRSPAPPRKQEAGLSGPAQSESSSSRLAWPGYAGDRSEIPGARVVVAMPPEVGRWPRSRLRPRRDRRFEARSPGSVGGSSAEPAAAAADAEGCHGG